MVSFSIGVSIIVFTQEFQPHIEIDYPDNDGNSMFDNTEQFQRIVMIKENGNLWNVSVGISQRRQRIAGQIRGNVLVSD